MLTSNVHPRIVSSSRHHFRLGRLTAHRNWSCRDRASSSGSRRDPRPGLFSTSFSVAPLSMRSRGWNTLSRLRHRQKVLRLSAPPTGRTTVKADGIAGRSARCSRAPLFATRRTFVEHAHVPDGELRAPGSRRVAMLGVSGGNAERSLSLVLIVTTTTSPRRRG